MWPTTKPRPTRATSGGGGGTNSSGRQDKLYRGNGNGSGDIPGSGMTFNGGGGSYPTQGTSNPPSPIKKINNWIYCHTHGGDIHNNHTSTTCAQPGVNHQHAATRLNTMGGNNKGLLKTILPGATGQCALAVQPTLQPTNYTPSFAMPFGNNGPWFPTAPGSWGFGSHAAAYHCTNNIPPPKPGTSTMQIPWSLTMGSTTWHHAHTSCIWSAQSWSDFLPEPLLTVRSGRWHT
jgi:hypothetical protein